MKALILAAGYAKRLYPYIRNAPKPLLPIAGEPLIELILSKIGEVNEIDEVLIITNELYMQLFQKWKAGFKYHKEIKVISDGTMSYHEKKGAIGDLYFVAEREQNLSELLVIGGDNLFEFNLQEFIKEFRRKRRGIIALYDLKDPAKLSKRFGVIEIDANNKIVGFEEKPETPKTSLASTLCYVLTKRELVRLEEYIKQNPESDNTGSFIKYLVDDGHELYGYKFTERWFDIGSYEQYKELNQTELRKKLEADSGFS